MLILFVLAEDLPYANQTLASTPASSSSRRGRGHEAEEEEEQLAGAQEVNAGALG